ncbi:MAG: hypothetical protein M3Q97_10385 [Bacteroidota bacterium]|nr:hypothetical protein [Bacteroidota bacterium]
MGLLFFLVPDKTSAQGKISFGVTEGIKALQFQNSNVKMTDQYIYPGRY